MKDELFEPAVDDLDGSSMAATETSKVAPSRKDQLLSVVALIIIALFTVFAIQNTDAVELNVFAWTVSVSRIVLMLLSALVGVIAATLVGRLRRRG